MDYMRNLHTCLSIVIVIGEQENWLPPWFVALTSISAFWSKRTCLARLKLCHLSLLFLHAITKRLNQSICPKLLCCARCPSTTTQGSQVHCLVQSGADWFVHLSVSFSHSKDVLTSTVKNLISPGVILSRGTLERIWFIFIHTAARQLLARPGLCNSPHNTQRVSSYRRLCAVCNSGCMN